MSACASYLCKAPPLRTPCGPPARPGLHDRRAELKQEEVPRDLCGLCNGEAHHEVGNAPLPLRLDVLRHVAGPRRDAPHQPQAQAELPGDGALMVGVHGEGHVVEAAVHAEGHVVHNGGHVQPAPRLNVREGSAPSDSPFCLEC